jgi:hypothetical protein
MSIAVSIRNIPRNKKQHLMEILAFNISKHKTKKWKNTPFESGREKQVLRI